MPSDLGDTIESAAATPAAASGDGQSVTARPLQDLIAADKHLAASDAANAEGTACSKNGRRGFLFTKLRNPGSV
jgi:hypothetical protein